MTLEDKDIPDDGTIAAIAGKQYDANILESRALAREVLRLRALLAGRTAPPTATEDEAARTADLFPHKMGRRWHFFDREGRVSAGPGGT